MTRGDGLRAPLEVHDPGAWDALVLALPAPHLLQGWAWGDLKARWGWAAARLAWTDPAGHPEAAALVLTRRVGRLPIRVGYVPKGPLLARPGDPAAWSGVLAGLEAWAAATGLVQLKMDADVPLAAEPVARLWRSRGWRPSPEQIQFPNTMISDLAGGEPAVWAQLKAKTRYNLRLAERRGVSVRHGGAGDLDTFYALYADTAARAGFGLRTRAYYDDAWRAYLDRGDATVILAERDGRALAGVIPVAFGDTVWYLYGASTDAGREHMPAYPAQWESLRWAIARGARRYDWWGGPTGPDETDPLWGVGRFKQGFGAVLVEQQGAWDYPAGRVRYGLYHAAARWRRAWIDRLARPVHRPRLNTPT